MTTQIGKSLVLLNLVLSVGMAFWAVGIYTQYIDYSTKSGEKAGLVPQLDGQIKARQEELASAEARWRPPYQVAGSSFPPPVLQQRANNREVYAQQLAAMQKGGPVKVVTYKDGLVVLDPKQFGRPLLADAADADGQPLQPIATYVEASKNTANAIHLAQAQLEEQIKQEAELTQKIGGDNGLRFQLAREEQKRQEILAEQDYLRPLLVNSLVDGELLVKRQARLEARVKELKAVGVAAAR